ncbi:NIPSNAP family protein [Dyella ginsengisoli]|uniref:NIPSNAP family protein n=1 Tax=Dyella ginsengisoli TaxID=363848 RepID=UPI00034D373D|nr:NIPSNAP family protein [Dyella ginsengisoli]
MSAPAIGVLELRQYTLRAGQRERLVELFEREFVESQEALGIVLPGQFRDLDDPDRFVWLRGFADMATRARALGAFYDGPVWHHHRDAANATMIDSDDVLLLRPWQPLDLPGASRPVPGRAGPPGWLAAMVCPVEAMVGTTLARAFDDEIRPWLAARGLRVLGSGLSETAPNNFPRLPVRENEPVFVWFGLFDPPAAIAPWPAMLLAEAEENPLQAWTRRLAGPPQLLRLAPTPRSLLRGHMATRRVEPSMETPA